MKEILNLVVCVSLGLLIAMSFTACDDDGGGKKDPGPTIVSITATPSATTEGGTVTVIVNATGTGTLTYLWASGKGEFDDTGSDTVNWTAPDETGMYVLSVIVSDDEGTDVGTINLGVNMYAPAVSPYYLGSDNCAQCHVGNTNGWSGTGHAEALETLQGIGQGANPVCLACHTVGYDAATANGGFDEVPVDRLGGVQCENCHGPGSDHNGNVANISISYDAELCGACHEDEHHPYIEEWEESLHAVSDDAAGGFVLTNSNCTYCHSAEAFVYFLDTGLKRAASEFETTNPISCQACHTMHDDVEHQLRTSTVDLVCGVCHTGDGVGDPDAPSTPHHTQWNALHGTDGFEYDGEVYADSPHKDVVEGKCGACHVSSVPFAPGEPAKTGHTFEPEQRACVTCHPTATDFDVNGVQTEMTALLAALEAELASATSNDSTTVSFLRAEYNFEYVEADASHGVHNYKYVKKLLEDSINDFTPGSAAN